MSSPVVIRIERPYETVEEFLAAEAWTIGTKGMVLVEQKLLPDDTVVRFELKLTGGERLIRAEARVQGYLDAADGRPGGPKVRFKRFDAGSKKVILRAVELERRQDAPRSPLESLVDESSPQGSVEPVSMPDASQSPELAPADTPDPGTLKPAAAQADEASEDDVDDEDDDDEVDEVEAQPEDAPAATSEQDEVGEVESDAANLGAVTEDLEATDGAEPGEAQESAAPGAAATAADRESAEDGEIEPGEVSGVHRRPVGPIQTPNNRDELLAQLRARQRPMKKTEAEAPLEPEATAEDAG